MLPTADIVSSGVVCLFVIVLVFTAVDGMESNVKNSIESLGSNVVYVQKWPWEFGGDYLTNDLPSGRLIRIPNSLVFTVGVHNYSWRKFNIFEIGIGINFS